VLAAAGIGSRRACEELIAAGRVEVDRAVVTTLGTRVDAERQEIRVDGERLPDPSKVVYMLNKPVGVVTTHFDPSGRPRVVDLVPGERRLFPIGRLDRMSEGLILVTNDGGLANRLAHPRYGVEKRYQVQVAGRPSAETLERLRQGVPLAEGLARVQRVSIRSQHRDSSVLDMVLDEGKNREIRRMLAKMGHKVHQLKRVAIGSLSLGNLLPGEHRRLGWEEVERLRQETVAVPPGDGGRPAPRTRAPSRGPAGASRGLGKRVRATPGGRRDGERPRNAKQASGRGATGRRNARGGEGGPAAAGARPTRSPDPRKRRRVGRASQWRKAAGGGGPVDGAAGDGRFS
jgi:23S rRNA pseudouridine2605 synthase